MTAKRALHILFPPAVFYTWTGVTTYAGVLAFGKGEVVQGVIACIVALVLTTIGAGLQARRERT